jgi:hypothetical protein
MRVEIQAAGLRDCLGGDSAISIGRQRPNQLSKFQGLASIFTLALRRRLEASLGLPAYPVDARSQQPVEPGLVR